MNQRPSAVLSPVRFEVRRALVRNLGDRVVQDPRFAALLSHEEVIALRGMVGLPTEDLDWAPEPAPEPEPPAAATPPAPPRHEGPLRLSSLEATPSSNVTLCLDFGTATSKVGAVRDGREPLPLRLGRDGAYETDSCLYLDGRGHLHFGTAARDLSLREGRPRIDSLKRLLGRCPLKPSLDAILLESLGVRGGGSLSLGQALRWYLAWLSGHACRQLAETHRVDAPAHRRFAVPCWPSARWMALKPALQRLVGEAILLSDTVGPELEAGLPLVEAERLGQLAAQTEALPSHLVGRAVTEPVAAAASRFGPEVPVRGLVLVIDVGAGTTDLALFVIDADPDAGRFAIKPLDGASDWLSRAGDSFDRALTRIAMSRLGPTAPRVRQLRTEVSLRVRQWKETLVRSGEVALDVGHGPIATVSREELFGHPEVADLEGQLRERVKGLLERLPESLLTSLAPSGLHVCLAGGGAHLPMVSALVRGETRVGPLRLRHRPGPELPPFIARHPELVPSYPRLAVALGGASGYLPRGDR